MGRTVDVIAEVLKREGTDRIFGLPGAGSNLDLIDAAKKAGIEIILCDHEASAAIIASVYGEIKKTPGICFSDLGPGATNMASGIAYAFLEQVSLLAFTASHPLDKYDFLTTQKFDQNAFYAPITKANFTVTSIGTQEILERAISISKEETPGPIHLDLPNDEAIKKASYEIKIEGEPVRLSSLPPRNLGRMGDVVQKIKSSSFPVIIAGIEAKRANAKKALTALAEKLGIPVMVSLKGRGVFDESHPLYGGIFLGSYTKGTFEDAIIGKSDLLIVLGLHGRELLPRPWGLSLPVIRVGFKKDMERVYHSEVEVVGDIQTFLDILLENPLNRTRWDNDDLRKFWEQTQKKLSQSQDELPPYRIIQITREKLPSNGILTSDVGAFNSLVHYLWKVNEPYTYFTSKGLSTMGIGLPAAIAAQIALPNRKVVCFTGDGGLLICIQDLEMCSRLQLPIVIIVFSDGGLGLVKVVQRNKGYEPIGVQFKTPDFANLMKAFGGQGLRATTEREFERALEIAFNSHAPTLIEAVLNPNTYGDHMKLIRG